MSGGYFASNTIVAANVRGFFALAGPKPIEWKAPAAQLASVFGLPPLPDAAVTLPSSSSSTSTRTVPPAVASVCSAFEKQPRKRHLFLATTASAPGASGATTVGSHLTIIGTFGPEYDAGGGDVLLEAPGPRVATNASPGSPRSLPCLLSPTPSLTHNTDTEVSANSNAPVDVGPMKAYSHAGFRSPVEILSTSIRSV